MKKAKALKTLKARLKSKIKNIKDLESKKIDENGRLDMEIVSAIQHLENDRHQIEKQISFINRGKCRLGSAFKTDRYYGHYI